MKQWARFDRYDFLIYLLNYPALIIANYIIFGATYFQHRSLFVNTTLIANGWGLVVFVTLTLWMKFMRFCYGAPDEFGQRLLYSMLGYVAVMMSVILGVFWVYDQLGYLYNPDKIPWVLMIGFVTNVTSAGCHESIFTYNQLRESTRREVVLKELNMQQQMDVLKQQVNPHFLFNSLSILSSVVHVDANLSEKFIAQLSKSYRYILEQKDNDLVSLKTEIEFIQSYAFLLGIRFREKFEVQIDVPEATQQRYKIAPLTLQLLVENAVKHTRMSSKEPLSVHIYTQDETLIVENGLKPRLQPEVSTGVGLKNITARYSLLTERPVWYGPEQDAFVVKIPLLV